MVDNGRRIVDPEGKSGILGEKYDRDFHVDIANLPKAEAEYLKRWLWRRGYWTASWKEHRGNIMICVRKSQFSEIAARLVESLQRGEET